LKKVEEKKRLCKNQRENEGKGKENVIDAILGTKELMIT
jgi:hypothetical protein